MSLNQYLADWKHHDGYYVREVVSVPGLSASEIFDVCSDWFEQEYTAVSIEDEGQVMHKGNGIIILKGWRWYTEGFGDSQQKLWSTIRVEVRDERFRYSIYDVYTDQADSPFEGVENEFNLGLRVDQLYRKDGTMREGQFKDRALDVFDALEEYRSGLRALEKVKARKIR